MTNDERKMILSMINEGKITAEEGYELIASLSDDEEQEEVITIGSENVRTNGQETPLTGEVIESPEGQNLNGTTLARMERSKRWWDLAAGFGILLVILCALGMYQIQQSFGINAWFFLTLIPLLLGVLIIVISFPATNSKWLFIEVESNQPDKTLMMSLPLSSLTGIINFFAKFSLPGQQGFFQAFWDAISDHSVDGSPILINVNDASGDRVKIFIA